VAGPPARKGAALEEAAALPAQARANPDLTLAEHCELFEDVHGVKVSTAAMSRAFEKLGLPLKKSPSSPPSATKKSESVGANPKVRRLDARQLVIRGRVRDAHLHDARRYPPELPRAREPTTVVFPVTAPRT
jgi:hypothetical protein